MSANKESLQGAEMADAVGPWSCPVDSNECVIRRQCTNKCGRRDPVHVDVGDSASGSVAVRAPAAITPGDVEERRLLRRELAIECLLGILERDLPPPPDVAGREAVAYADALTAALDFPKLERPRG